MYIFLVLFNAYLVWYNNENFIGEEDDKEIQN